MNNLREQYFAAIKQGQRKQLVSKSAAAPGPNIYAIKNQSGEIIGFVPGERLSPAEVAALKTDIAKSAETDDPNAILDDLFDFGSPPAPVEVSKSVEFDDAPNAVLDGVFPQWLQTN